MKRNVFSPLTQAFSCSTSSAALSNDILMRTSPRLSSSPSASKMGLSFATLTLVVLAFCVCVCVCGVRVCVVR